MANLNNNKNNSNKSNNKTNKAKVHKVPIISSEALALAGKVHSKFPASEYEEVYELLNDFVDSLNVDEDGIITLETFWECGDCIEGIDCDECKRKGIDCLDCDNVEKYTIENDDDGLVSLFNSVPDTTSLNEIIERFEEQFDTEPYLVMGMKTLEMFEYIQRVDCLDFEDTEVDCDNYEDCKGCIFDPEAEGCVTIECDDETDMVKACYYHNDKEYTILIDNELAFGIVKVR